MTAQELKPCPFCGGEAAIEYEFHTFHGSEIRCQSCSSASGHYEDDKDSAKAIAAWNRRQPVARTPLTPYTLREIIKKLNANHDEDGWNFGDLAHEVEIYHGITQEKQG